MCSASHSLLLGLTPCNVYTSKGLGTSSTLSQENEFLMVAGLPNPSPNQDQHGHKGPYTHLQPVPGWQLSAGHPKFVAEFPALPFWCWGSQRETTINSHLTLQRK